MIVFVNSADFGFGVTYGILKYATGVAIIPTGIMALQFEAKARPSFKVPARTSSQVPARKIFKAGE